MNSDSLKIIVEHVRSFAAKQEISLRPLTFLVGENSSGKSTFLSIVSSVMDELRFPSHPGLNDPPYNLGTFDTIATYKGGKYGRDQSFSIGFSQSGRPKKENRTVVATYESDFGDVRLSRLEIETEQGSLNISVEGTTLSGTLRGPSKNGRTPAVVTFKGELPESAQVAHTPFIHRVLHIMFDRQRRQQRSKEDLLRRGWHILNLASPPCGTSFSFAPIRSKPKRTYDEVREDYSPEGDHVPTLLARLLGQDATTPESQRVLRALQSFGEESGLFKHINVKMLGNKVGDPFQLQVGTAGPRVNLADVGYGVSQALPIVVQSVVRAKADMLLMQQPEVHLHPRAQAALGTFFAELAAGKERMLLVETHSDYMIDRVRQEVAAGKIPPEKVSILFFHKPRLETKVHEIGLDCSGNVCNAPPEYRQFFLDEEISLLSRTGA